MSEATTPDIAGAPPADVRPRVAVPTSRLPLYVFVALALVGGVALFSVLDARRHAITAPATRPTAADLAGFSSSVPALYIPPDLSAATPSPLPVLPVVAASTPPVSRPTPRQAVYPQPQAPQPIQQSPGYALQPVAQPAPPSVSAGPAVVFDNGTSGGGDGGKGNNATAAMADTIGGARASAGHLPNPATTIPQGAVIHAVLETALDSTRSGLARAIVSDDVRGFDGTRILIPRGSRLIGEYDDKVARGQNRALVMWTRLIRPDGVTIALQSPVADPLGRAGVKARVNSHFLERFGSAILQSALQVGVNLASRHVYDGTLVVGLPGSTTNIPAASGGTDITPTLKVRQGTSVSVFVARDLDFTAAEGSR